MTINFGHNTLFRFNLNRNIMEKTGTTLIRLEISMVKNKKRKANQSSLLTISTSHPRAFEI